jgi:hypothetical protein
VETISPTDLMAQGGLPPLIDSVEHNHVPDKRAAIYEKLKAMGYFRMNADFDDWYFHPVYLDILNGGARIDYRAVNDYFGGRPKYGDQPA